MSLIIDSLKKITKPAVSRSSVPPSLLNLSPASSSKSSKLLLGILIFSALVFLATFFLPDGSSKYQVRPAPVQTQTTPAQPQPEQTVQNEIEPGPQYDPTAANRQRLLTMQGLPEINKQRSAEQSTQTADPAGNHKMTSMMPPQHQNTAEPQTAQPQQALPQITQPQNDQPQLTPAMQPHVTAYQPAQTPVYHSNPSNILTGRAKQEYDNKIDYNTRLAQASEALDAGNYRKAEELFSGLLSEKQSKYTLSGLLSARIRAGMTEEVIPAIEKYKRSADASVICSAATELNRLGQSSYALDLLSRYSGMQNSGQIFYTAGLIQESLGNNTNAESSYAKASAASPADPYYMYAMARNKDLLGKYKESIELYKNVIRLGGTESIRKLSADRIQQLTDYIRSTETAEKK
ncbi:MAG: hypothetical protein AB7E96_06595 [Deferribacterales bacterium]